MTVMEAFGFAIFTLLLVVGVLAGLALVVILQSKIIGFFTNRTAAKDAPAAAAPAPAQQEIPVNVPLAIPENAYFGGDLRLYEVDDETAAMVMAIVSDDSGIPLSELIFKSIKKRSAV